MKDMFDVEIEVGDEIAAPFIYADSPVMRIGIVKELVPLTNKLRVNWTMGAGRPRKPSLISLRGTYSDTPKVIVTRKQPAKGLTAGR